MGLQCCWKVATGFYRCRDKAHTDAEFDVRHELNRLSGLLRYCDALINGLGYHCTATESYWYLKPLRASFLVIGAEALQTELLRVSPTLYLSSNVI